MPRSVWSGAISFGLVNIPVKLVSAVRDKSVRFHLLHKKDHARIQNKRVCTKDGHEVDWEDLERGFEVSPEHFVTFTEQELEALEPESSRTIDLTDFVDLKEIDPTFFDHPYYLVPDARSAKSYGLLLSALDKTKRVGIATMVMRGKSYLVALRPKGDILMLETMRYAEEVVPADVALEGVKAKAYEPAPKERAVAEKLIDALSADFDPAKYKNEYRERVLEIVEKKAEGHPVEAVAPAKKPQATTDLMAALERSLEAARRKVGAEG